MSAGRVIFSRPGRSQVLLYKQLCDSLRGSLETLFIIHRAKLLPPISPHPMDQHSSFCCFNFLEVTLSYHSKVNLVGALDAEKLEATVLFYVLLIGFPTSRLSE